MPTWQSHYQSSNKKKQQYENSILHRLGCDWANLSGGRCQTPLLKRWQHFRIKKEGKIFALLFVIWALRTETKAPANYPLAAPPCFSGLQMQTTAAALQTWIPQTKIHPWDEYRPLNIPKNLHITCRVKSIWSSQVQKKPNMSKKKPANTWKLWFYEPSFHKSACYGFHPRKNVGILQQWWKAMSYEICLY